MRAALLDSSAAIISLPEPPPLLLSGVGTAHLAACQSAAGRQHLSHSPAAAAALVSLCRQPAIYKQSPRTINSARKFNNANSPARIDFTECVGFSPSSRLPLKLRLIFVKSDQRSRNTTAQPIIEQTYIGPDGSSDLRAHSVCQLVCVCVCPRL